MGILTDAIPLADQRAVFGRLDGDFVWNGQTLSLSGGVNAIRLH